MKAFSAVGLYTYAPAPPDPEVTKLSELPMPNVGLSKALFAGEELLTSLALYNPNAQLKLFTTGSEDTPGDVIAAPELLFTVLTGAPVFKLAKSGVVAPDKLGI